MRGDGSTAYPPAADYQRAAHADRPTAPPCPTPGAVPERAVPDSAARTAAGFGPVTLGTIRADDVRVSISDRRIPNRGFDADCPSGPTSRLAERWLRPVVCSTDSAGCSARPVADQLRSGHLVRHPPEGVSDGGRRGQAGAATRRRLATAENPAVDAAHGLLWTTIELRVPKFAVVNSSVDNLIRLWI